MSRAPLLPHPRTLARGTRTKDHIPTTCAIVYAPDEARQRWIELELARGHVAVQLARSVRSVIAALIEDPAPRPQVLVIDLDALSPGELFALHEIRAQGWCGTIVALGTAPPALRKSLRITRVIPPPFPDNTLCDELVTHRHAIEQQTMRIPLAR